MKIKEMKKGEFFTVKAINNPTEKQVWVRGEYDKSERKYECYKWDDVCSTRLFKGDKEVFTGFTF